MNRSQHRLGDFFVPPDQVRFNFEHNTEQGQTAVNSFEKNINKNQNLVKHYLGENVYYSASNATQVDNIYVAQKQMRSRDSVEVLDNQTFHQKKPAFKSTKSSKRSKTHKKTLKKKLLKEERMMTPTIMETDEESDEDRNRELMLQREIEREQEYQNQMNMIYNNPEYFQQHFNHLEYREEFHHPLQQSMEMDHQACAPMYFIALPQMPQQQEIIQPHFDKEIFASDSGKYFDNMTGKIFDPAAAEETSSDYYSDSASCLSDYSEDDEMSQLREWSSFDNPSTPFSSSPFTNPPMIPAHLQEYDGDVPLELDEELNNLVLSIISD